jgi:undecaprenyl diphosphate synthase
LHFVGDRLRLSAAMQAAFSAAEHRTASNTGLVLNICFNYGGRWDIAQAARKVADSGQAITELALDRALALAHVPDPDLFIRTGGELRVSNFLLWQAAYAELHFTDKLWPEFDEAALDEAIAVFRSRERRFGQTSAQLTTQVPQPSSQSIKAV